MFLGAWPGALSCSGCSGCSMAATKRQSGSTWQLQLATRATPIVKCSPTPSTLGWPLIMAFLSQTHFHAAPFNTVTFPFIAATHPARRRPPRRRRQVRAAGQPVARRRLGPPGALPDPELGPASPPGSPPRTIVMRICRSTFSATSTRM